MHIPVPGNDVEPFGGKTVIVTHHLPHRSTLTVSFIACRRSSRLVETRQAGLESNGQRTATRTIQRSGNIVRQIGRQLVANAVLAAVKKRRARLDSIALVKELTEGLFAMDAGSVSAVLPPPDGLARCARPTLRSCVVAAALWEETLPGAAIG